MKIILIITALVILTSCDPVNEYNRGYLLSQDTELGDVLTLSREDTSFIRYLGTDSSKIITQKGTYIQYHDSIKIDTVKTWGGSSVISSHINQKMDDSIFILIEQKPLDFIFGEIISKKNMSGYRPKRPNTVAESMRMISESEIKFYWIINKRTDDIYGPYSKEMFNDKLDELCVSSKLKTDFQKNNNE